MTVKDVKNKKGKNLFLGSIETNKKTEVSTKIPWGPFEPSNSIKNKIRIGCDKRAKDQFIKLIG